MFIYRKSLNTRILLHILCFSVIGIILIPQNAWASLPTVNRLSGEDRFQTAIAISAIGWPSGAETVILAKGDSFPDALAGATLAKALDAPILLTQSDRLPEAVSDEITRLNPAKIVILGGYEAVSQTIESSLDADYDVNRLGGNDRYETAANIARHLNANDLSQSQKAVIAYGQNFPDALAISSWAAANHTPILLSETDALSNATAKVISELNISSTVIVGGTGVINSSVEAQLPSPVRYGGIDRYDTAVRIANGLKANNDFVFIATGENFPDALAGSVLAAKSASAVILVARNLPDSVKEFFSAIRGEVSNITVLGGAGAVDPNIEDAILAALQ